MFKSLFLMLLLLFCNLVAKAQVGGPSYGNGQAYGTIAACLGTPSASPNIQQFTVTGNNLTTSMTVSAPGSFEVSLTPNGGYTGSVTITPVNGNIAPTTVYARSAAYAPVGAISGQCIISTSGHTSTDPILSGTIYTLPVVNTIPNQVLLSGNATQPVNFTGTGNTYTWVNNTPSIGLAANGSGNIASFNAVNNGSDPVTATIAVTAVVGGFAYIPNSGDGTVSVVNTVSDAVVATIPVGSQPYGVILTAGGATAYVSNQGSGTVSVIDTKTNTVIHTVAVGSGPTGMSLTPDSLLFLVNENDNTVAVVNPVTYAVATRPVGVAPVNVLCNANGTVQFVANSGSNSITVMNEYLYTVATIPVGQHPAGMALSPDGSTLYVANTNSNTISVISTQYYTVNSTITLGGGNSPKGMVISGDGNTLYVTNAVSGTVSVVSTVNNSVNATIPVGQNPMGIAISDDGSTVYAANAGSNNVSVISTATDAVTGVIPVGTAPVAFGQFLKRATGCESTVANFTITVNPPTFPTITYQGMPSALSTTYGMASAATTFTVLGANTTSGILVTPPAGFEVSTDNVNFGSTVTAGAAGNSATVVYIRLTSSTPVGNYTGNIQLSSAPVETVTITMPTSTVTPAPLTITADNKSRLFGAPNPELTVTYSGFVNDDIPEKLKTQPQVSTIAVSTSPAGQYPITVAGATSPNYTIAFISGILTVLPPLFIPNTFTPNGDGINDKWEIDRLSNFANCTVTVFNRYGQTVYRSTGYGKPWNGTYNGSALPTSTYYYIIDLKSGGPLLSGFVMIVR